MLALAEAIEAHAEELAQIESLDNGKPVGLAQYVDVAGTVAHLRYFAGWPTKIEGGVLPVSAPNMLCYTRREPVGVCAQIIPWNFPLLMAAWKLGPALAAGCTIVLKPAEQTPLSALRLGELALEVGFPPGVLNVLTGDGGTGRGARRSPGRRQDRVHRLDRGRARDRRQGRPGAEARDARAGRQVAERDPRRRRHRGRREGLLSGDLLQLRPGLQRGLAAVRPGRALRRGRSARWPSRRTRRAWGRASIADTQLGPLVSAEQRDRVMGYIESGRARGRRAARRRRGRAHRQRRLLRRADAVQRHLRRAADRARGDLRPGARRLSLRHARGGRRPAPTTASTGSPPACGRATLRSAHRSPRCCGRARSTSTPGGASIPSAPFGGFKASGIGREHGHDGLDAYLETKTVWTAL